MPKSSYPQRIDGGREAKTKDNGVGQFPSLSRSFSTIKGASGEAFRPRRLETALARIGKLYAVEKDLRQRCEGEWQGLSLEERVARVAAERQQQSRPLLDSFRTWLESEAPKVLPKSDVRGAMDYTLNNWRALSVYAEDGWLDIDNNEAENSLRGICLGRRNWLFCGSDVSPTEHLVCTGTNAL